jgi:hypothetical protein
MQSKALLPIAALVKKSLVPKILKAHITTGSGYSRSIHRLIFLQQNEKNWRKKWVQALLLMSGCLACTAEE